MSLHETAIELKIVDLAQVLTLALEQGYRCSYPSAGEHMHLISEPGDRVIVDFDSGARLYGDGAVALAEHLLRAGAAT